MLEFFIVLIHFFYSSTICYWYVFPFLIGRSVFMNYALRKNLFFLLFFNLPMGWLTLYMMSNCFVLLLILLVVLPTRFWDNTHIYKGICAKQIDQITCNICNILIGALNRTCWKGKQFCSVNLNANEPLKNTCSTKVEKL